MIRSFRWSAWPSVAGVPGIVARTAALRPHPEISLTTNGIGLARLAGPLAAAGLNRVTVSLDTLSQCCSRRNSRSSSGDDRSHDARPQSHLLPWRTAGGQMVVSGGVCVAMVVRAV